MKTYKEYANYRKLPVDVPGLSPDMCEALEEKITEFEENHLDSAINGGDGFVPRIQKKDIVIASVINGIILIYYIWALVS